MSFEKLLWKAQNGDKEAQEEIFQMYRPFIIKIPWMPISLMRICIRNFPLR